jgi:hypothetical protein
VRFKFNPLAVGREDARRDMARRFPEVFSLATDGDVARASKMKERCTVLIKPDDPRLISIRRISLEARLQLPGPRFAENFMKGAAYFFGAILFSLAEVVISSKTKSDIALSVLLFAAISKLELAVITFVSYYSEIRRLMRKGVDEMRKHPAGMPIYEIGPNPATSSGKHQ